MIALPHRRTPEPPAPPARRVTNLHNAPMFTVDAASALDCTAPAVHVVGDRCSCETHHMEVKRAYWLAESRALILHDIDESAGYRCGDTYTPEVSQ